MVIIKLIIYLFSIILPGYLILLLITKQETKSFYVRLALSYGLGAYFITIQLFLWLFIFRFSFSWWFYILLAVEFILLIFFAYQKSVLNLFLNINFKLPKKLKTKELIIILLIFIQLIFLFANVLSRPVVTYDSMTMWSYKAKVLYYENKVNFNLDSSYYLGGGGHINYPWHVPLMQFWLHVNLGEYNDLLINLIFVFYFICLLIVCYYFFRDYISRFQSLLFAFFLCSMPLVFYHGFNAYADLTLSFYVLLAFIFLYKWIDRQERKYLTFSSIFAGISFFIKNEAIIYIIASLAIIALYITIDKNWKRIYPVKKALTVRNLRPLSINYYQACNLLKIFFNRVKYLFHYTLFVILPILPWLVFKAMHNLDVRNVKEGIGFYPEILGRFLNTMFTSNSWNIWWFVVVVSLIINFKKIIKNKTQIFGWLFLILSFSGFLILYLFTEEYVFAMNSTANARNILTLIPISVFITAISFKQVNNSE